LWHAVAHGATLDFLESGSVNKFSIAGVFKGVVAASVLVLLAPNTSRADDHLLSVNSSGTVTVSAQTPAVITDAGAVTTPLTFTFTDPPPANNTTTVTLGTSQTVTMVRTPVKMCKPGTNNQLEWLDQGNTVIGVNGTLTSGTTSAVPNNGYRLTLTFTFNSTYASSNGPCTVSGQQSYTSTKVALLEQQTGGSGNYTTKLNSTYNFWNATNTAPEPDTVLLMLMGLLVLGWMSRKRMHTGRSPSA
jgi:hypothetical protein